MTLLIDNDIIDSNCINTAIHGNVTQLYIQPVDLQMLRIDLFKHLYIDQCCCSSG